MNVPVISISIIIGVLLIVVLSRYYKKVQKENEKWDNAIRISEERKVREYKMKAYAFSLIEKLKEGDKICMMKKEWSMGTFDFDLYIIIEEVTSDQVKYKIDGANQRYSMNKKEFADKVFAGIIEFFSSEEIK